MNGKDSGVAPHYARLFELSDDLLCVVDFKGMVRELNPYWTQLLGYTPDEIKARSIFEIVHPEDRLKFFPRPETPVIGRASAPPVAKPDLVHMELRMFGKGGETHWIAWRGRVAREEQLFYAVGRETTASREAAHELQVSQEALVHGESRFRAAMNGSHDAVLFLDCERGRSGSITDLIFTDLNENAERYLHKTRDEIIGRRVSELFPWILHDALFEKYVQAVDTGIVIEEELDLSVPGHESRWLQHMMVPLANGIVITARDITLRKDVEATLRAQQTKMSEIVQNSHEIIFTMSLEGAFTFVSGRWRDLLGHEPEEVEGSSLVKFVHADDIPDCMSFIEQTIETEGPRKGLEFRIRHKDGRWCRYSASGSVVRDEFGTPSYFVGTACDVTERRELEEKLEAEQRFLETVIDQLPVALFCKDVRREFRFSLWNKKAEEIFGLAKAQMIGKNDYDFFPKEQADFFRDKDEQVMKHMEGIDIAEEPVEARGKTVLLHTKKAPLYGLDGSPEYLLGISENISERKAAERLFLEQQARLATASKLSTLEGFCAGMSHEIKNPLLVIQGNAQDLENMIQKNIFSREQALEICSKISSMVDKTSKIIGSFRSFARDAAKDELLMTSLSSVIEDSLELCRARFFHHHIALKCDEIPVTAEVEARPAQLTQVLVNLLNNSFDAVAALPEKWVRVGFVEQDDFFELSVTDSGGGIPPQLRDRIMEPFFTTKDAGQGMGIGLSLSRGIAEAHGGKLWLDEKSQNTRFVVQIPKKRAVELKKAA